MSKKTVVFFCTECGNETPRWQGQCPACSAWNTLVEEPVAPKNRRASKTSRTNGRDGAAPVKLGEVTASEVTRWGTGLDELDYVLGGGIVPGSLVLLGGEPGIGKSTLLLQVAARLEADQRSTLYVSGEESGSQIRMRADRLNETATAVTYLGETDLTAILAHAEQLKPAVLIVDSIQTVFSPELESAPGNVTQVRECAARLQRFAKESGTAVFLVGHVTKDGVVAGPRTLEHIVDTVLYFEGATTLDYRMLRASKNRFGSVDEIGVFRMSGSGLTGVANPSELFLSERSDGASGAAVAAILEGTRPVLVEVQALCAKASYGSPQRVANGYDRQRLTLLLAILERRAGMPFGQLDVFLNVVGGVRISEPAADCAIAAALVSAVTDRAIASTDVFIGEVGLGGELRSVTQLERRLAEAERMGFRRAHIPRRGGAPRTGNGLASVQSATLSELIQQVG